MKIKYKFLIIAIVNLVFFVSMTYFMFQSSYFGYIQKHQDDYVTQSFYTIRLVLNNEQHNLSNLTFSLSHLDETYDFTMHMNHSYIDTYLNHTTLESTDVQMVAFLDNEGALIYKAHPNLKHSTASLILSNLNTDANYLENLFSSDPKYIHCGLLKINEDNYIVALSPITQTTLNTPSANNGYLVLVRQFPDALIDAIEEIHNATIIHATSLSENMPSPTFLQNATYKSQIIKDINGLPSIAIIIPDNPSDISLVSFYTKKFAVGLLFIVLFFCMVNVLVIDKLIIKRLNTLDSFLDTATTQKDATVFLDLQGNDELDKIAMSANQILKELHNVHENMHEMDSQFVGVMEATNDGYLEFNFSKKEMYVSPKWKEMVGYRGDTPKDLFSDYVSKIHPDCLNNLRSTFALIQSGLSDYFQVEYRVIKDSGSYIWVLHRGKILEKDEKGNPLKIISTLTNITDRKNHEDEISFLSHSDRLTGLNNRAYMENQLQLIDDSLESNYCILMVDINGLRLVNDNLGHKEGDRLLQCTSAILKKNCAPDDVISRWGGDAFVILCVEKELSYVSSLVDAIRKDCDEVSDFPFKVSLALGYARNSPKHSSTQAVMGLAEQRMYRNKLLEPRSARSATIMSLSRSLYEKHNETEEHTMRIRNLSLKLGKRLYLSHDILDELELLALLHDIGKIGIPDHILMKPTKLSQDEWEVMKTHTSIGYRIAQSTPELAHIADEILAHHEKYDGQGYPNGLKGDEIPLLARIINVVDSFDVMTYKRIYKEAFTIECAIQELIRCSGTQFDPFIVEKFIKLLEDEQAI